MEKYISQFKDKLDLLLDVNVVIGGLNALIAHGLNVHRESNDIDIIIYQPTNTQLSLIEEWSKDNLVDPDSVPYDEDAKVTKLESGGLHMDIILEYKKTTPENLLLKELNGVFYQIQSIKNVIEAKCSYAYNSKGLTPKEYMRSKDLKDLLAFKNVNFNIPEKTIYTIDDLLGL